MKQTNLKILIVVHDAGGAELLSSIVTAELKNHNWQVVVIDDSPAKSIFNRKHLSHLFAQPESEDNISAAFELFKPDYLFCGTSFNKFELPYIKEAGKRSVSSISFLDHWINYRERFDFPIVCWENNLPDYTAVSDNHAFHIADNFKVFNLLKIKNYYIAELLNQHDEMPATSVDNNNLLFISEAIEEHRAGLKRDDPLQLGYTQTEVIEDVLNNFMHISNKLGVERIVIRLHPAEASSKYDELQKRFSGIIDAVENPAEKSLNGSIENARSVIGINSMALMIAHLLGKPVISYIPANQKCVLPLPPECCIHSLTDLKDVESIPCWKHSGRLSFYDEYDLSIMLNVLREMKNESCRNH